VGFLLVAMLFVIAGMWAQTANDYRSIASGNWSNVSIWEKFDGSDWVPASSYPNSGVNVINIGSNTDVTISSNITADQLVVQDTSASLIIDTRVTLNLANGSGTDLLVYGTVINRGTISRSTGATIIYADNSLYNHDSSVDNTFIPQATWLTGSTCLVSNVWTPGNTRDHSIAGVFQEYYNIIWDVQYPIERMTIDDPPKSIAGDLIIRNTGLFLSAGEYVPGTLVANTDTGLGGAYTLDVLGDFRMEGGKFDFSEGNKEIILNLTGDFFFAEGAIIISGNPSGNAFCSFNFEADEDHEYTKLGGYFEGRINFTVESGATFDIGTSILGSGSSGTFTLEPGATIITANPEGISTSGATGSIQVAGTRTFSTDATYVYNGEDAQITGSGLPATVANLIIDNPEGVSLTNVVTVSGTLTVLNGEITGENQPAGVDGYFSPTIDYIYIEPNNTYISDFSIISQTGVAEPTRIDRMWSFTGSFTGTKTVTFYWTAEDDNNYVWLESDPPVIYSSDGALSGGVWSIDNPRQITYNLSAFPSGTLGVGLQSDGTLPVELTSFTATAVGGNSVRLEWITQSETNALGFRIYRGDSPSLSNAVTVGSLIPATNTSQLQVYVYYDTELFNAGTYYYWLESQDLDGSSNVFGYCTVTYAGNGAGIPPVPVLSGINTIHPNPASGNVKIVYGLAKSGLTSLVVYNLKGQKVRNLFTERKESGTYFQYWDGRDIMGKRLPSGVYLMKLSVDKATWSGRVTLIN
jgi:hypothetical protein